MFWPSNADSPLCRVAISVSHWPFRIAVRTRCGAYGLALKEGFQIIQQRIAGLDLAGIENSVAESVLT